MKIKRTLIASLVVIVILLYVLTCCRFPSINFNYVVVAHRNQVPFGKESDHWNEYQKISEDEFGRELFYCNTFDDYTPRALSDYTKENEGYSVSFYLIVQRHNAKIVQIYDNDCYMYVVEKENVSDETMVLFKEKNDWNQKFDQSKVLTIPLENNNSPFIIEYDVIEKNLGMASSNMFVDALPLADGRYYYVVRHILEHGDILKYGKSYLFLITDNGTLTCLTELEGQPITWNDQIRSFKEKISVIDSKT